MSAEAAASEPEAADDYAVGMASDFPVGTHKVVKVRSMEIGVFNVDGSFYALPNMCPHQYGPLAKGPVGGEMVCSAKTNWKFEWRRNGEILTCPWHALEFEIKTGECIASKRFNVRSFPARVVDGEVRVRLRSPRARAAAASDPAE